VGCVGSVGFFCVFLGGGGGGCFLYAHFNIYTCLIFDCVLCSTSMGILYVQHYSFIIFHI